MGSIEIWSNVGRGDAKLALGDLLWCASDDDLSSRLSAFRPHVYDMVGCLDDIEVMFDDNDSVAFVNESVDDGE